MIGNVGCSGRLLQALVTTMDLSPSERQSLRVKSLIVFAQTLDASLRDKVIQLLWDKCYNPIFGKMQQLVNTTLLGCTFWFYDCLGLEVHLDDLAQEVMKDRPASDWPPQALVDVYSYLIKQKCPSQAATQRLEVWLRDVVEHLSSKEVASLLWLSRHRASLPGFVQRLGSRLATRLCELASQMNGDEVHQSLVGLENWERRRRKSAVIALTQRLPEVVEQLNISQTIDIVDDMSAWVPFIDRRVNGNIGSLALRTVLERMLTFVGQMNADEVVRSLLNFGESEGDRHIEEDRHALNTAFSAVATRVAAVVELMDKRQLVRAIEGLCRYPVRNAEMEGAVTLLAQRLYCFVENDYDAIWLMVRLGEWGVFNPSTQSLMTALAIRILTFTSPIDDLAEEVPEILEALHCFGLWTEDILRTGRYLISLLPKDITHWSNDTIEIVLDICRKSVISNGDLQTLASKIIDSVEKFSKPQVHSCIIGLGKLGHRNAVTEEAMRRLMKRLIESEEEVHLPTAVEIIKAISRFNLKDTNTMMAMALLSRGLMIRLNDLNRIQVLDLISALGVINMNQWETNIVMVSLIGRLNGAIEAMSATHVAATVWAIVSFGIRIDTTGGEGNAWWMLKLQRAKEVMIALEVRTRQLVGEMGALEAAQAAAGFALFDCHRGDMLETVDVLLGRLNGLPPVFAIDDPVAADFIQQAQVVVDSYLARPVPARSASAPSHSSSDSESKRPRLD